MLSNHILPNAPLLPGLLARAHLLLAPSPDSSSSILHELAMEIASWKTERRVSVVSHSQ
jgi:hypothetical protein